MLTDDELKKINHSAIETAWADFVRFRNEWVKENQAIYGARLTSYIPATNPMPKVEPEKLTIEARLARIENILERMLHRNY